MSAPPYNQDYSKQPPQGYPPEVYQPPGYPPQYHGNGSAPPHAGFHQQQQMPAAQPQVIVVSAPALGSHKVRVTCRNCRNEVQTTTEKKASLVAWISAGVMCFFGCWFGCCCAPFCMDSCMDTDHLCPNCGAHVGTHRAF